MIETDGCTGFPDQIGHRDLGHCCTVHDLGGTDRELQDCLINLDPSSYWWILVVVGGVLVMQLLRPAYNLLQKWGIFPKTPGSRF